MAPLFEPPPVPLLVSPSAPLFEPPPVPLFVSPSSPLFEPPPVPQFVSPSVPLLEPPFAHLELLPGWGFSSWVDAILCLGDFPPVIVI